MPYASLRTSSKPVVYSHDLNGYRRGCRCDACRAASAAHAARTRASRLKRQIPEDVVHGANCYSNWKCRCEVCVAAWTEACRAPSAKYQEANADRINGRKRARNDRSRETAERHGYQWTGPELELAARHDLGAAQVAAMTGRTIGAVRKMRHRLRGDPKIINLAGLSRQADEGNLNRQGGEQVPAGRGH